MSCSNAVVFLHGWCWSNSCALFSFFPDQTLVKKNKKKTRSNYCCIIVSSITWLRTVPRCGRRIWKICSPSRPRGDPRRGWPSPRQPLVASRRPARQNKIRENTSRQDKTRQGKTRQARVQNRNKFGQRTRAFFTKSKQIAVTHVVINWKERHSLVNTCQHTYLDNALDAALQQWLK